MVSDAVSPEPRYLWTLVAAIALFGCGKDAPPAAAPPPTTAPASAQASQPEAASAPEPPQNPPQAEVPRKVAAKEPPEHDPVRDGPPPPPQAPDMVVLVNGQGHAPQVVAGWPVIVRLELSSPDGKPWRVSGGSAPWSRLVKLEMPGGTMWPLEPAFEAPNEATVDGASSAELVWVLGPEQSAALPRGERTLYAILDSPGTTEGAWKGVARTREIRLKVVNEPRPLPPAWAERKAEVEVEFVLWREGAAKALARLESAAAAQKKSWQLLGMKGQLLSKLGRGAEAVGALDQALESWVKQNPGACEPLFDLLAQREAIFQTVVAAAPAGVGREEHPPEKEGEPAGIASPEPPETRKEPEAPRPLVREPEEPRKEGAPLGAASPPASRVQVSGLVFAPPAGWKRAEEEGVTTFRPEGPACRIMVLPGQELDGGPRVFHATVLDAMLKDYTVAGEMTTGTRHGFQWSAGQVTDKKGETTWLTLFTIVGGGRAESILFDADSRDAYGKHVRDAEALIDGAELAPAAKPDRPQAPGAKPEDPQAPIAKGPPAPVAPPPCDRVGDLEIARRNGWRRTDPAPGAAVFTRTDVPAGRICMVSVYPSDDYPGAVAPFADAVWAALTQGGKIVESAPPATHGPFVEKRGRAQRPDGLEISIALFATKSGGRARAVAFFADAPELFASNLPVVRRMLVPPADVPIKACYMGSGLEMSFEIDGGQKQRAGMKLLALFENGLCLRLHATSSGVDTTYEAYGLASIDAETLKATKETDRRVGWWTEAANGIRIEWANGDAAETLARDGENLKGKWSWSRLPPVDGVRLEGTFARQVVGGVWALRLTKDGRFETDGLGNVLTPAILGTDFPERGAGTYEVRKWTMVLRFDGGYTATIALMPPVKLADATAIFLNEYEFTRE